jgi:hypothetical protein
MKSVSIKVDRSAISDENNSNDINKEKASRQSDYISLLCRKGPLP